MKYHIIIIIFSFIQFGCFQNSNSQTNFPPPPEYKISKVDFEEKIFIADSVKVGNSFESKSNLVESYELRILNFVIYVSDDFESLVISDGEQYFDKTCMIIEDNILNIDKYNTIEVIFRNKEGVIYKERKMLID